jgi:hypothetical protein
MKRFFCLNTSPHTQRDQLWKLAFRMLMQQIVEFYFYEHYDEIDWSKEPVFLDKELNAIQMKFGNPNNYRIFEKKMDRMVKYETTADILSYWNFERKYEILEKSEKKTRLQLERSLIFTYPT